MISVDEFRKIRDRVFAASKGEETELVLGGGRENLTRFGENRITQNVSEERYELRVRVREGRRAGVCSTNDLSESGLAKAAEEALALARIQKESDQVLPFLAGDERIVDGAWEESSASLSAAERASWIKTAVGVARRDGIELGGIALSSEGSIADYGEIEPFAVANTTGLLRYGRKTRSVFEVSASKGDGAGRARARARAAADIDPRAVAEDACRRALSSREPADLPAGKMKVVFEAPAVEDLVSFLTYMGFNGLYVAEKRSPLWDKLGKQAFGANIHLHEDPLHPNLRGLDFDAEGVDCLPTDLIKDGVVKSFLHDRASAFMCDAQPTGHGLPAPNSWGAFSRFPVLEGGSASLDELIGQVEDGVLVTKLWYTNVVDPQQMIITGMTRDGTFRIRDGKLGGPVKNFRFNQNLGELFNKVESLGEMVPLGELVLPHLLVKDFNFTSGTDF